MYDFYFGNRDEIQSKEKNYLLFLKRLLPRWTNSIPDSEYLAIFDTITNNLKKIKNPVFVETGSGASTLVLLYLSIKFEGRLFSWDTNGSKGAFLRSVITDTISRDLKINLWDYWTFIPYNSTSKHLGISILEEMGYNVDFSFHDSEHTEDVLLAELNLISDLCNDYAIIALDDANYCYKHYNTSYINRIRKNIGLTEINDNEDNIGACFFEIAPQHLKTKWNVVNHLSDTYKTTATDDIFWKYYPIDKDIMVKQSMEKTTNFLHRYDCWQISGKK